MHIPAQKRNAGQMSDGLGLVGEEYGTEISLEWCGHGHSDPDQDVSPDYARWLPILRNQLKDMDFSRIRHVLAFVVTNDLMH
jgi:hypothetical protein